MVDCGHVPEAITTRTTCLTLVVFCAFCGSILELAILVK